MPEQPTFYTEAIRPDMHEADLPSARQLAVAAKLAAWPGWALCRTRNSETIIDVRAGHAPLTPTMGSDTVPTLGWDTPGPHDVRLTLMPHPGGAVLSRLPEVIEWAQSRDPGHTPPPLLP